MTDTNYSGGLNKFHQTCNCCAPSLSRRQFVCAGTAAALAAPALAAAVTAPAMAQAQPVPSLGRPILIKGGCVLSLDRTVGDFEQADVLVRGSKIAEVRPNISAPDAEVIDASKAIVMPGFVDSHRHMWQGILRNIIPDASLQQYFQIVQRTLGPAYAPDDVHIANLVSARTSRTRRNTPMRRSRGWPTPASGRSSPMGRPPMASRNSGMTRARNIPMTSRVCANSISRATISC